MCKTTQFIYSCNHVASHQFRSSVCGSQPYCHIIDDEAILPYPCRACKRRAHKSPSPRCDVTSESGQESDARDFEVGSPWSDGFDLDLPQEFQNKRWYIPSRCFVDIGFRNLDPFNTGRSVEKGHKRAKPWPSPCCARARRDGVYQATRLEGIEFRIRGKIVDSKCGSQC